MTKRMTDYCRFAAVCAAFIVSIVTPVRAEDAPPSAQELLQLVRAAESAQTTKFVGKLRRNTDDGRVLIPFHLTMNGATIAYQFDSPPEQYVLTLGGNGSKLQRVTGNVKTQTIVGAKLDQELQGTDITYEDLALKFLYWNNAKVVGTDRLDIIETCWMVDARSQIPTISQYTHVRLWIEPHGGLLKADSYIGDRLVRRFKVNSVQRAPAATATFSSASACNAWTRQAATPTRRIWRSIPIRSRKPRESLIQSS